jgi:hypothetical protein
LEWGIGSANLDSCGITEIHVSLIRSHSEFGYGRDKASDAQIIKEIRTSATTEIENVDIEVDGGSTLVGDFERKLRIFGMTKCGVVVEAFIVEGLGSEVRDDAAYGLIVFVVLACLKTMAVDVENLEHCVCAVVPANRCTDCNLSAWFCGILIVVGVRIDDWKRVGIRAKACRQVGRRDGCGSDGIVAAVRGGVD